MHSRSFHKSEINLPNGEILEVKTGTRRFWSKNILGHLIRKEISRIVAIMIEEAGISIPTWAGVEDSMEKPFDEIQGFLNPGGLVPSKMGLLRLGPAILIWAKV